jgi:signal transduction histidine kinase
MDARRITNKLEALPYMPTALQQAMGVPLRSEQRTGELLPAILSRIDMFVIFIAIVLFIPNASVVQASQGAGMATYFYWLLGTLTFLVPCAVVSGQLNRLIPAEGGIYVWTHRALGPLWGFFAAFCAWFPGVLVLLAVSDTIIALLQGIGWQIVGHDANWLVQPWQQGMIVLGVIFLSGWLAMRPLRPLMNTAAVVIILYGLAIFTIGLVGVLWLLMGHPSHVPLVPNTSALAMPHFVLYGVIVLALLGVEVPFNMSAETKDAKAHSLFLRWGPLVVLIAYALGSFGVMVVVPASVSSSTYSTLTAMGIVFGAPAAIATGIIFIAFFLFAAVIYNATFARILFVSALDERLPASLAAVNRHRSPAIAISVQIVIVALIAIFAYFIGPLIYASGQGTNLSTDVYNVAMATTTVIWCISMVILFIDLPVLLVRFRALFARKRDQLIAPPWLLSLCCVLGGLASVFGISFTLSSSWDSALIPDSLWTNLVGVSALVCLVVGLIGSAYPRLLSNLNRQTAAARENARLYEELRVAYIKLSELDHLKDAFLMTASHELRTPLTIVQGYLELLGEMEDVPPQVKREFISKARRACDELVILQANIMDASRIKFDTASLQYTDITLRDVCVSVTDLFEPLILKEQRRVEIAVDPSIHVWADEARLKQILRNLVANAGRYSPPQTLITITAIEEAEQELVRINVIDRGAGIPVDKQEMIFERFVRLERDMAGTSRGSGLGLAITKQLVEAMHGRIWVESSGIAGEGSTFSFTLPNAVTITGSAAQPQRH